MLTEEWRRFDRTSTPQILILLALTDKRALSPGLGRPFSYIDSEDMKLIFLLTFFPNFMVSDSAYCWFRAAFFRDNSGTSFFSLLYY